MTIQEFVDRQKEYIGQTAAFTLRWNDGEIITLERRIELPEEYRVPENGCFEVLEVEVRP